MSCSWQNIKMKFYVLKYKYEIDNMIELKYDTVVTMITVFECLTMA